jgi:hypothetical protein
MMAASGHSSGNASVLRRCPISGQSWHCALRKRSRLADLNFGSYLPPTRPAHSGSSFASVVQLLALIAIFEHFGSLRRADLGGTQRGLDGGNIAWMITSLARTLDRSSLAL